MSWSIDVISEALQKRPVSSVSGEHRQASVILPMMISSSDHGSVSEILFTVRSQDLSTHPGEVAFPGGKAEPQDPSAVATAVRETVEEIGVNPAQLEILGALTPRRSRHGLMVYPFVACLPSAEPLVVSEAEIAEVFTVPVSYFETHGPVYTKINHHDPDRLFPEYRVGDHRIWGLTALILHDFLISLSHQSTFHAKEDLSHSLMMHYHDRRSE